MFILYFLSMELLQQRKDTQSKPRNRGHKTNDIITNLCQRKSINEDLQHLWLALFSIKNNLLKTQLEKTLHKNKVDDDSYRCFIAIFNFINSYDLNNLVHLAHYYKSLYIESESKLLHFNQTKREQITFLKKTLEYLVWEMTSLKEKLHNSSLIFVKENAFSKPGCFSIQQKHIQEMNLFLSEFPSRINSIETFLDKIYSLWSDTTKDTLVEYKKREKYL